jgi:tol-pal system protein YbgF
MKKKICFCLLIALATGLSSARAGTKEELMRLQSDVLALQNQMREFEKTFNERTDGLKSLVVQLNDQVAKTTLILNRISTTLENQASGVSSADQTLLREIRTLSGKIDDTNMRVSAMAQQLEELKIQAKPIQSGTGGGGLSGDSVYSQAFTDLVEERPDLAIQGFTAYLNSFPEGEMAGSARYNIGEAYYSQNKLPQAIAAFTRYIDDYPDGDKVATALFRKAKAELAMKETQNAIADFRQVIEKFPESKEATLAKDELQKLGVSAKKPAPAPARRKTP